MNDKDFDNGCFAGDWTEFECEHNFNETQRKDLAKLLIELEDIKNDFDKISTHKDKLNNMLKFYNGSFAAENQ